MRQFICALLTSLAMAASAHASMSDPVQFDDQDELWDKTFSRQISHEEPREFTVAPGRLIAHPDQASLLTPGLSDRDHFFPGLAIPAKKVQRHDIERVAGKLSINLPVNERSPGLLISSSRITTQSYAATTAMPIPESETWGLIALGFGLIGLQLRRNQTHAMRLSA